MAVIKAFRGIRYNGEKIKKFEQVLAPPYDVISKKEQGRYYNESPFNVIRLELGKDSAGDNAKKNKYTRAAHFLNEWLENGVLKKEAAPAVYVVVQDYREEGKMKNRIGFIAAMELDEKQVLKHENTLAAPKKDRLALLKEVRTNLSPIFGLFEDRQAVVQKALQASLQRAPALDVSVSDVRHRLYVEDRPQVLKKIISSLQKKPMFIADGHHRLEVAFQYKRLRGPSKNGSNDGGNYVMTYFSDVLHNPFKIFPTHRLIHTQKTKSGVVATLKKLGDVQKVSSLSLLLLKLSKYRSQVLGRPFTFGVYTKKEGFWLLTLSNKLAAKVGKNPVQQLDVAVLHQSLIAPYFGVKKIAKSKEIDFTRDPKEAVGRVNSGEFSAAFFLRPTSLEEMITVSKKGLKMPQKSTYFYPKLLTGMVFHSFGDS